jgi:hypothetical protein
LGIGERTETVDTGTEMKKKLRLWLIKKLNAVAEEDYSKYVERWDTTKTRLEAENKSLREELQVFVDALYGSNKEVKMVHEDNTRLRSEILQALEERDNTYLEEKTLRRLLKQLTETLPNIKDSDKNEGTDSPWWAIIMPKQIMEKDPCAIASCIVDGIWFSRESAEAHLNAWRYEYGDSAIVYCFSGYWSREYRKLLKDVSKFKV